MLKNTLFYTVSCSAEVTGRNLKELPEVSQVLCSGNYVVPFLPMLVCFGTDASETCDGISAFG